MGSKMKIVKFNEITLNIILDLFVVHLPGLQSVNSEQIDSNTFEIVNAGDQLSFNISKQITP